MNISEILKYCPKGTKLYSTAFGEVELISIYSLAGTILVQNINNTHFTFYNNGSYILNGECILFPSKNQRDWNKFRLPVKKGDIMMFNNRAFIISNEYADAFNGAFHKYIWGIDADGTFKVSQSDNYWTSEFYIPASEEAKKELFDKMAEAGYRWNADTLELEKIKPRFKEGDILVMKDDNTLFLFTGVIKDGIAQVCCLLADGTSVDCGVSISSLKLASITERNKFHSALVREGYKYDKWQHKLIKQEFKPFDKVLVRDIDTDFWKADIYLGYMKNNSCPYRCTKANYGRCIPYEGNEYLLDTANSPT